MLGITTIKKMLPLKSFKQHYIEIFQNLTSETVKSDCNNFNEEEKKHHVAFILGSILFIKCSIFLQNFAGKNFADRAFGAAVLLSRLFYEIWNLRLKDIWLNLLLSFTYKWPRQWAGLTYHKASVEEILFRCQHSCHLNQISTQNQFGKNQNQNGPLWKTVLWRWW